jgi:hypothetical protein
VSTRQHLEKLHVGGRAIGGGKERRGGGVAECRGPLTDGKVCDLLEGKQAIEVGVDNKEGREMRHVHRSPLNRLELAHLGQDEVIPLLRESLSSAAQLGEHRCL